MFKRELLIGIFGFITLTTIIIIFTVVVVWWVNRKGNEDD